MSNSRTLLALVLAGLALCAGGSAVAAELDGPVSIVSDQFGVPTIVAETEHDAIYVQGYLHARDRLFQMDFQRRLFSGRVAEMVGPAGIPQDVQLRTLGLRRAAERSLAVQTPEVLAWLEAYAEGVNAYLQDESQPLPLEFFALEIDRDGIPPWTALDSLTVAKGLAFSLSFDLEDIDRTLAVLNFRGVCEFLGCNGLQLFNDDLYRTAPFEAVPSIPPPIPAESSSNVPEPPADEEPPAFMSDPNFESLVQSYRDSIADIPILKQALESDSSEQGSNWWVAAGARTDSGYPMLANDPHLSLGSPATFYEVHLNVTGGMNVTGVSFPGAPGIVLGCNDTICWGATVNAIDVTDVYNEVLVPLGPDPTVPTHTLFRGVPEPLQFIPQTFLFNAIGDGVPNTLFDAMVPATSGGVTLVVPRRNNGPIVNISFDPTSPTPLTGLSVQYVGWSGTQELETFRRFARAGSMQDFKDALQYFDVGSQNWAYADINGNIAYYTSGELPLREDLQTLFFPAGLQPPSIIRDGTNANRHEWLPLPATPEPNQSLPFAILPFAEMPQIENPPAGYILNANNDPIGTTFDNVSWNQFRAGFNGLLYLSSGYATGYRMGRLQRLFNDILAGGGTLSLAENIAVQGNNQLLDAEVLTPYLLDAYANATAPGAPVELAGLAADPRIGEAIGRLAAWDFSTPTGIDRGFDPGDNPAAPGPPSQAEIDASVASTIYAVWRGQYVQRVVDTTLASLPIPLDDFAPGSNQAMSGIRRLLDNSPVNGGTGASLINFFTVPGAPSQAAARDIILLQMLHAALDLLASDTFAPAFANSTDQNDYRWGMLHRIVFKSFLAPPGGFSPFDIPPPGAPENLSPDLPGFARAGGMGALDASAHSARADGLNEFMFGSGPSRRVIATMTPDGPDVLQVIPGGESGVPGSPHQVDQLPLWLVNAYKPLPVSLEDVLDLAVDTQTLECGDGVTGPGEQCDDGNTNNADGCNDSCELSPQIICGEPSVPADVATCDATVACDAIATCVGIDGSALAVTCDPTGTPYPVGTTDVTVQCSDGMDMVATSCPATVFDPTPPMLSVSVSPDQLWPPNHRMVEIVAETTVTDDCSTPVVTLESVSSSEPDNAVGNGDGDTVDDIQNDDVGMSDFAFDVRAERAGAGPGRVYTVTYAATDDSGNQTTATATIFVPHDQGGVTDPVQLTMSGNEFGALVNWHNVPYAESYNVVRASLSNVRDVGIAYNFGNVTCVESASLDESTLGHEDPAIPAPGQVFLYFVEYYDDDGARSSYGSVTAAKPRVVRVGNCE